jgi:hypothetical protein
MQTEAAREFYFYLPMMADVNGKVAGFAIGTSTSAVTLDLQSMNGQPQGYLTYGAAAANLNPIGPYISIQAEGVDCYLLFGPSYSSVTGANAPAQATVNTITGNGITNYIVGLCLYLPVTQTLRIKLPQGSPKEFNAQGGSPARFLSVVTKSGTGVMRLWQSSPL